MYIYIYGVQGCRGLRGAIWSAVHGVIYEVICGFPLIPQHVAKFLLDPVSQINLTMAQLKVT